MQEASLNHRLKFSLYVVLIALLARFSPAQNQSSVALDTSETLFTVLTAINTCGYDQELGVSDPAAVASTLRGGSRPRKPRRKPRTQLRQCASTMTNIKQPDASRTLSQYVSLALYLNPSPNLTAKVKEADMPPDATAVLGILPLMQKFYEAVGSA